MAILTPFPGIFFFNYSCLLTNLHTNLARSLVHHKVTSLSTHIMLAHQGHPVFCDVLFNSSTLHSAHDPGCIVNAMHSEYSLLGAYLYTHIVLS